MQNTKKDKKPIILIIIAALLIVAAVVFWLISSMVEQPYELSTYSMGSIITQKVYGEAAEAAAEQVAHNITLLEEKISWRVEDSDIQRLNAAAGGEYISVDESTYQLLSLCSDVSLLSDGLFDATIAPLSQLWDFDSGKNIVPSAELIDDMVENVDYTKLLLSDGKAALKTKGVAVDLGAVGKGAACDIAVNTYESLGIESAVVAVGGSVGVYGDKSGGKLWRIAVRNPYESGSLGELELQGGYFVSTSGSYEKSFTADGKFYHHILNPQTGYPSDNELISVTVIAKSGALSDALSTACFVAGRAKGEIILKDYGSEVLGAIYIDKENKMYLTGEADSIFTLSDDDFEVNDG